MTAPEKAAPIPADVLALARLASLEIGEWVIDRDRKHPRDIVADLVLADRAARPSAMEEPAPTRSGWLAAVDALDEMAKAMGEKAETFRSPNPFDPATMEEADAATTGWVIEQAAKLLRERAPTQPDRAKSDDIPSCDICDGTIQVGDLCSIDIDMGIVHATCAEGSATVDLDSGKPIEGPIRTFRYEGDR